MKKFILSSFVLILFCILSMSFIGCNDFLLNIRKSDNTTDNGSVNGDNATDNGSVNGDNATDNGSANGDNATDNQSSFTPLPDLTLKDINYKLYKDNFTSLVVSPTESYVLNVLSSGLSATVVLYNSKTNSVATDILDCKISFGDNTTKMLQVDNATHILKTDKVSHFNSESGVYVIKVVIRTTAGKVYNIATSVAVQKLPLSDNYKKPFSSDLYYGRSLLATTAEKNAYDIILAEALKFDYNNVSYRDVSGNINADSSKNLYGFIKVTLRGKGADVTQAQLNKIIRYIMDDDPRAFTIASPSGRGITYYVGDKVDTFYMLMNDQYTDQYYNSLVDKSSSEINPKQLYYNDISNIEANTLKLIAGVTSTMTDSEKFRVIHDAFINFIRYGDAFSRSGGKLVGSFTLNRRGKYSVVCEGYARGMQYLSMLVGIKAIYVDGTVWANTSSTVSGGSHAWNYINIDNKWYGVDPTWDDTVPDGGVIYKYYLRGSSFFDTEHTPFKNPKNDNTGYEVKPSPISNTDHFSSILLQ